MEEGKINKKKKRLNKETVNIIRTAMRNNIELTNIADNKANVLLSINTLIITLLVPVVLINAESINKYNLGIPLTILVITSIVTIYLLVLVLIPRGFGGKKTKSLGNKQVSPFFFGNFYKMSKDEFNEYFDQTVKSSEDLHGHIVEDLYFLGTVLAEKMTTIRIAFYVYMTGFVISVLLTLGIFFMHNL